MRAPLWLLLAAGCAAGGETEAEQARRIAGHGAELYRTRCSSCHEVEGGIGPRLRPPVIGAYDPQRLFEFLRRTMPYGAPGTLTEEEYRSVVHFLMVSRGLGDSSKVPQY